VELPMIVSPATPEQLVRWFDHSADRVEVLCIFVPSVRTANDEASLATVLRSFRGLDQAMTERIVLFIPQGPLGAVANEDLAYGDNVRAFVPSGHLLTPPNARTDALVPFRNVRLDSADLNRAIEIASDRAGRAVPELIDYFELVEEETPLLLLLLRGEPQYEHIPIRPTKPVAQLQDLFRRIIQFLDEWEQRPTRPLEFGLIKERLQKAEQLVQRGQEQLKERDEALRHAVSALHDRAQWPPSTVAKAASFLQHPTAERHKEFDKALAIVGTRDGDRRNIERLFRSREKAAAIVPAVLETWSAHDRDLRDKLANAEARSEAFRILLQQLRVEGSAHRTLDRISTTVKLLTAAIEGIVSFLSKLRGLTTTTGHS